MELSDIVLPVVSALGVVGASSVSAFVLLHIHHKKVKQEMEIHRKRELFDRKQKAYRSLLKLVSENVAHSSYLGTAPNWKIGRDVYVELLLIGGKEVIDTYNQFIKKYYEVDDAESSKMVKELVVALRKDLYDEILPLELVKFSAPSQKVQNVIAIYKKNEDKLNPLGLYLFSKFAKMDIDDIHVKTGISKEDLKQLKECGEVQSIIEKEYRESKENTE